MSAFVLFAIIFTLCLLIYYAVMIALDLRKQGKKPSTHREEFDVSGMQGEEAPKIIAEAFAEPEEKQQESLVPQQESKPEQEQPLIIQSAPPAPHEPTPAELKVEQVKEGLTPITVQGSAELPLESYADLLAAADQKGPKFGIKPKT